VKAVFRRSGIYLHLPWPHCDSAVPACRCAIPVRGSLPAFRSGAPCSNTPTVTAQAQPLKFPPRANSLYLPNKPSRRHSGGGMDTTTSAATVFARPAAEQGRPRPDGFPR